ncbi:MAG TPA: hypothetical protein VHC50_01890 [Puia sp.]|nr:hypothetical protein [Puia sp.]
MYNNHILTNNIQASSQYFSMTGFGGGFRILWVFALFREYAHYIVQRTTGFLCGLEYFFSK